MNIFVEIMKVLTPEEIEVIRRGKTPMHRGVALMRAVFNNPKAFKLYAEYSFHKTFNRPGPPQT